MPGIFFSSSFIHSSCAAQCCNVTIILMILLQIPMLHVFMLYLVHDVMAQHTFRKPGSTNWERDSWKLLLIIYSVLMWIIAAIARDRQIYSVRYKVSIFIDLIYFYFELCKSCVILNSRNFLLLVGVLKGCQFIQKQNYFF